MAWVSPSTQITGDLITASIWNQNVVANTLLLKTPITDSGKIRLDSIQSTTTTGSEFAHDITYDVIVVKAGDVTVKMATATASSTGRRCEVKNWGTGIVTVYAAGAGVSIDGSTSTSLYQLYTKESATFVRWQTTDYLIV